jgi:hypothetical protein
MDLFLGDMKSHIFHNDCKNILHNIMWGYPLPTMHTTKKMDPHKKMQIANKDWKLQNPKP